MKKLITIILLGMFIFPGMLHGQELKDQQKSLYQNKVYKFTKMKKNGIGLTFGGVILTAGGIAMMTNSGYDSSYYSDSVDGAGEWLLGYLTAAVGIGATVGGITLWSIGNSKAKSYNKRLNSLSLNLNPAPKQMISLSYRF
jgi:hypothetical protein